ncbi:protein unc-13 homolog 4B isoform X2 [Cimex lectularius]|uniref:Protein unc-13 homolog 4B n=1 Tax=Cimex lectularius TaxID=79782 RepID=A0A8I6RF06_CIMLE|nr:protein unc-13 homolog 4B isoform X2 [Cimex lectularius]
MDQEDIMWKRFCTEKGENPSTPIVDLRIQELDNGFFEKFGTLLNDQDDKGEKIEETTAEEEEESDKEIEEEETGAIISDVIGLNIDELYEEVLYEILHTVGCDSDYDNETLFSYLKDAFKMDEEKHAEAMRVAKEKEAPNILLNVEVIKAKDLYPKDANGLSDPFVTLYLTKNASHRYNTSVKSETLSPSWEEYFSLPAEDTSDDTLAIEVWDFDPAETVREKMSKITGVKGVKGLRKLMKEIAVTASTGKHDNEIIGFVNIPLKSIPSSGHVKWYNLEKKTSRTKSSRGAVQLKLAFSSEKNNQVAAQEHRHLMRLLVLQEMEHNKPDLETWDGTFTGPADVILRQHAAQSGLRPADERMAQWVEYIRLHVNQPLNFRLLSSIITSIVDPLHNGLYSDDEIRLFWDGTKRLLPSIFGNLRKYRKVPQAEKTVNSQLDSMLNIIAELLKLDQPDNIELFPKSVYGWIPCEKINDISFVLNEAIKQSALEWFQHLVENNKLMENSKESKLQQAIKVVQSIKTDIQKSIESLDKAFYLKLKMQYSKELFVIYDDKIAEMVEPLVIDICTSLKPIRFRGNVPDMDSTENASLAMGTSLFELYIALQRCLALGKGMLPVENSTFKLKSFHNWFHQGVVQWLDIAVFKAMQRIDKAVDLDKLIPVDSMTKHSSSSTDTLFIFYQIKIFWTQLAWPDVEGSYTFVNKIIDDICRCSVYYVDKMGNKVEKIGETESAYGKQFEVTNEWCLAINSIDHVRQSIKPFVSELGTEDIIKKLSDSNDEKSAQKCEETLLRVVENAVETVCTKIIDLLERMALKMRPSIKRFLLEGAELIYQGNNHVERLMQYLDGNLMALHENLSPDNFDRILNILWDSVYDILMEVVQDSLEKRRPPGFFDNLDNTLNILVGFFKQTENVEKNDSYIHIKQLLKLHGMGTDRLIHEYYLERLNNQRSPDSPSCGLLTVKVQFTNYILRVEILNARNLMPHDSNGSCDPYVKINLLPEEKFANVERPRTKSHKKNLFPLFDETFSIQLTREQFETPDALVHFVVKDQDFFGVSAQFVAETFIPFNDIPRTTMETSVHEMSQVHLKLTKPSSFESKSMKAIDHRQGEKLARDFIKKQKAKMLINNNNGN